MALLGCASSVTVTVKSGSGLRQYARAEGAGQELSVVGESSQQQSQGLRLGD